MISICFAVNYSVSVALCRLSSLSELSIQTDAIKTEIGTVVKISRRVAEECTRHTISESIKASLSKMEVLSHQLCQVTKVKLKYCQGDGANFMHLIMIA